DPSAWSPDGTLAAVRGGDVFAVRQGASPRLVFRHPHGREIRFIDGSEEIPLALDEDGMLHSGGPAGSPLDLTRLIGRPIEWRRLCSAEGGAVIVYLTIDGELGSIDRARGERLARIAPARFLGADAALLLDRRRLAVLTNGELHIHDLVTQELMLTLPGP